MRPLALPLINRLQLRMRRVVDDSDLAAAIRDLSQRLERVEAHLRADRAGTGSSDMLGAMSASVTALSERVSGPLDLQIRSLQLGLDALRLDRIAESRAVVERLDALRLNQETANRQTAERLDALRLDQQATAQQVTDRVGAAHLDQQTANQQAAERIDALRLDQQASTRAVQEALTDRAERFERIERNGQALSEQVRAAAESVSGLVGTRTDLLLGRVAIPLGEEVLMRTPEGYLLVPAEDVALLTALHESGGRLEPGTVALIQALLREGDTALDVGANLGLTVLPAARRVGETGRVIAVEPGSRVAGLLRRSLAMNGLDGRVLLHQCAAGDVAGRAALHLGAVSGHSSLLGMTGADRTEEVEVRTLDELVPPGTRVRLAKIDVEGYEDHAWRGMRRIAAENPDLAVLVEFGPEHLRRAGIAPTEWLGLFTGAGFTVFEVDEATGALRPARAAAELALVQTTNLLLLREPPASYPGLTFA